MGPFAAVPSLIHAIGREGSPLVTLDGFAADPAELCAAAEAARWEPGANAYPGVRAPLPRSYWAQQQSALEQAVAQAFGRSGTLRVIDASFSMVTTPPGALSVRQRLPHCDAFAGNRVALVHYLARGFGGTAFFRHRSTGFETVDEARRPIFFGQLEAELRHGGRPPAAYIAGDTALFEQIAAAEGRFNRAVLYSSMALHSGVIAPDATLSPDPRQGG